MRSEDVAKVAQSVAKLTQFQSFAWNWRRWERCW